MHGEGRRRRSRAVAGCPTDDRRSRACCATRRRRLGPPGRRRRRRAVRVRAAARPASSVVFGHTGTYHQPPGTWSDDGALMLALLDSLLSVGFDTTDQAKRALAWRDEGAFTPDDDGHFDIGLTTADALSRIASGTPAETAGGTNEHASGNGSLMRILPIALVERDADDATLVDHAQRASRVTHGTAHAQVACALYVLIARRLFGGSDVSARDPGRRESDPSGHLPRSGRHGPDRGARPPRDLRRARRWRGGLGQLLVRLGRLRRRRRLPLDDPARDRLRRGHRHHRRHRRRPCRHPLGHRGDPADWLAGMRGNGASSRRSSIGW